MRGRFGAVLAGLIFALQLRAQSSATTAAAPAVVLDVVVQDSDGHPVRGLKLENFRLTEDGVAQALAQVEEHPSPAAAATPTRAALPAGTFADYLLPSPGGALNLLVIDALNTPVKDLGFFRYQLLQYVTHANPKERIAIVGLANRPILLQGFTSDPAVLRDVLERKLIARTSTRVAAADGSSSAIELAANLREFESELPAMETQLRTHYSLDALNTLAHYLAGFPGRKNLIWFSGSFPLSLGPDASPVQPSADSDVDKDELRETVNLLSKARVAIYPADARGLMNQPVSADTNPVRRFSADLSKFPQTEAAEHARMQALAADTGGRAFYDTSSLADAVSRALAAAADFYTLSYTPTHPSEDGSYRAIRVDLTGAVAQQQLQLVYRSGYDEEGTRATTSQPKPTATQSPGAAAPGDSRAAAYRRAAMSRGAPTPQDLLFKVRIVPASVTTETSAAPDNQLALGVPTNGPFRRYDIDYLSLPGVLTFTPQPNGHRTAKVEFLAYVFDTEGRLLDETGKDVSFEATPTNFARLQHSVLRCHLELSVPDRAETFLRIGVRDVTSNKFGVIEIPASSVSSLPAAGDGPAPTNGRATPPQD